ncbi:hypothetical protein RND81_06G018200 [Saponaria officinalis]|uniref:ERCC4 domain-containing protein n=1 Tax=Saponaria officinalis TaxID=3572 RepID=A0AAW1K5H6_SAPOF
MSHHIPIELLSDDDDDNSHQSPISNPNPNPNNPLKKRKSISQSSNPPDFLIIPIDDDPTPPPKFPKSYSSSSFSSPPLIIPETPFSQWPKPRSLPISSSPPSFPVDLELIDVESQGQAENDLVKSCSENFGACSVVDGGKDLEPVVSLDEKKLTDGALQKWLDIDSMCYLHTTVPANVHNKNRDTRNIRSLKDGGNFADSYVEVDCQEKKNCRGEKKGVNDDIDVLCLEESPIILQSTSELGHLQSKMALQSSYFQDDSSQGFDKENTELESDSKAIGKEPNKEQAVNKKKSKEEKLRLMEEKKLKKEEEKLQKAALKAEAAKLKELEKEKKKLEKFKFSEKNIIAKIDTKVIQLGKIGGHLVTKFGEKDLKFDLTSNLVEKSIIWRMTAPEGTSQLSIPTTEIPYILLVYEAEEFCKIVNNGSFFNHISSVQTHYPDYMICCLTNRLMSYINKRENDKYKNRKDASDWERPPVEEVFARLTTQFANVHSRQCADEAELAEHVIGLTCNLAKCYSRKKLSHLSVNANGSNVPKDCPDRRLIMKHPWIKALVSIPKVQPRFAIAIWKKYPNMKNLLSVYLDPTKSVHEKEFLLKDLHVEDLLGNEDRRLGEICSKRVYRILMAHNGSIKTDDAENGADVFM